MRVTLKNTDKELYNEYIDRFYAKRRYLRSKGITPRDIDPLKESKFKDYLHTYRTEHKKTSVDRAINAIIVKDYKTASIKQARNIVKQSHMSGSTFSRKYSLIEAMYGGNVWEEISEAYHAKRDEGLSSYDAKSYIAMSFFGSN